MTKVCLSGYYGFDNMGNDLIMLSIITNLRSVLDNAEIIVLSDNPGKTEADYGVQAYDCWNYRQVMQAIRSCDILISGGGNLLKDTSGTKFIRHYLRIMRMAQRRKKPVFVFAQRIGAINSQKLQNQTVKILRKCAKVTVRDEDSARQLQRWGFRRGRLRVTADPIFLIGEAEREWLHDDITTLEATTTASPQEEAPVMLAVSNDTESFDTETLPLIGESFASEEELTTIEQTPEAERLVTIEIEMREKLHGKNRLAAAEQSIELIIPDAVVGPSMAELGPEPDHVEVNMDIDEDELEDDLDTQKHAALVTEDTIRLDLNFKGKRPIEKTVAHNSKLKARALAELAASDSPFDEVIVDNAAQVKEKYDTKAESMARTPEDGTTNTIIEGRKEEKAALVCPTCGKENELNAHFCNECGNPLPLKEEDTAESSELEVPDVMEIEVDALELEKTRVMPTLESQTAATETAATPAAETSAAEVEEAEPSAEPTDESAASSGEDTPEQIADADVASAPDAEAIPPEAPAEDGIATLADEANADDAEAAESPSADEDANIEAPAVEEGQKPKATFPGPKGKIGKGHPANWKLEGDRLAGFFLRNRKSLPIEDLATLADMVARSGYHVAFIPFQYPEDNEIGREIIAKMEEPAVQFEAILNAKEMLTIFDELDFVFSTRLHPLMLAATNRIPFATLGGETKIEDFMERIGLEMSGDLNHFERNEMLHNVAAILEDSSSMLQTLEDNLPTLQEEAEENLYLLQNVLRRSR